MCRRVIEGTSELLSEQWTTREMRSTKASRDPALVSIECMVEETAHLQPRRRGGLRVVRDSPVLGECY